MESDPTLFLVATPIGNLEDISPRAVRILGAVKLIAAEDTRHTRKLTAAHGIRTPLLSYREQNHAGALKRISEHLRAGEDVALVSDAGTPGISDPGAALVASVVQAGFRVVSVPGPCAAVAALAASGLPTDRFLFLGFLPRKAGTQRKLIEGLAAESATLVFYESPHRLGDTLRILAEVLGPRWAVVVREISKVHETFDRGPLSALAQRYADGTRGEVTLIVAGYQESPRECAAELRELVDALCVGRKLSPGEIARLISKVAGRSRREVYQMAIGKDSGDGPP